MGPSKSRRRTAAFQPVEKGSGVLPRVDHESGIVPRGLVDSEAAPPRSGTIPKLWEEEDPTDVSKTTDIMAAALRRNTRPCLTIMTGVRAGEILCLDDRKEFVLGRSRVADVHVDEQGVSRTHCRLRRVGDRFVIEDLESTNGTFVNGEQVGSARVAAGDRIQIGPNMVVQLGLLDTAEETLGRRLFEASTRDPLTGAFNRRHFSERLEGEIAYARRHKTVLAVMLLDLDHFKTINDSAGHAAGDVVLRAVVGELARGARTEDMLARYGGEEFVVLTRADSTEGVLAFAERLRARVESLQIPFAGRTLRVTASVGVAELDECAFHAGAGELLKLADRRLYAAKSAGRNRVCART